MTEIERRAVLNASVTCRPARTQSSAQSLVSVDPHWDTLIVIQQFEELIKEATFKLLSINGTRHQIRAWSFSDVGCGIQFKKDASEHYAKLSECRQFQWASQTARGIPTHKPTDLTLSTHYARNGDIQFKLTPAP